ncbi:MAG: SulP family inorganic anion transporter [Akkermansiaceae bacterium]|nr:SulP family inorganic anion transporter [Akkermansiaceae bacterium]
MLFSHHWKFDDGQTLASKTGDRPDMNQDMFAVGMSNFANAIAGGMPASGSLTRSMLNYESGAQTRFASLISGAYTMGFAMIIAASVKWGVPLIDYVPKAALAGLVIALSFSLFNLRHIRICLRSTTDDAAVLVITFIATLLAPLHVAIFIGVAISITLFLRKASRPYLIEYEFNEAGELRDGRKKTAPDSLHLHCSRRRRFVFWCCRALSHANSADRLRSSDQNHHPAP